MASPNKVEFLIRVTIDKEKAKVLFAEVSNDFADTLISFLTFPLGTIVRLLGKKCDDESPIIGSLNALYRSLQSLDNSNFWAKEGKLMLLNPKSSFESRLQRLKINIDDTEPTKYFVCANSDCTWVSMYYSSNCACGKEHTEITLSSEEEEKIGSGVFTTESSSFIISDDLLLLPNFVGSGLQILKDLGIEETSFIEEKTIVIGFDEIIELLKLSFISSTPLTDLFFQKKTQIIPSICGLGMNANTPISAGNRATMNVKVIVQKSTGKVVLLQTREDFVDFLYSLLSIPLGRTLSLLNSDSTLGSISNLYKSLQNLKGDVHGLKIDNTFKTAQLPPMYQSQHQLLPITEQTPTPQYCYVKYENGQSKKICLTQSWTSSESRCLSIEDPKGCTSTRSYIKGPALFTVTDDLCVRPMSAASGFYILSCLKISLSDVEEHNVDIGRNDALSILEATLNSTSVLNRCFSPMLKKQPKQEK